MPALTRHLAAYHAYHRDLRNVATHMVGVPMLVFAVAILLSRPVLPISSALAVTPAMALAALAGLYYLRLDRRLGLVLGAFLALSCRVGLAAAGWPTASWLGLGAGLFVAGWAIQFLGHWFEGRKPAFFDDLRGLVIAPLFIVAELAILGGLRRDLRAALGAAR